MKIILEIKGKKIEATVDDKELEQALHKPTGYEVPDGRPEYSWCEWYKLEDGLNSHKICCLYSDKDVAQNNMRADQLMMNLRKFAAEHGGAACPWDDDGFALYWDHLTKQVKFWPVCQEQVLAGAVRFKNEDAASGAIEKFKVELEWYFTCYNPMPPNWWLGA